jgi:hypothetical protein
MTMDPRDPTPPDDERQGWLLLGLVFGGLAVLVVLASFA